MGVERHFESGFSIHRATSVADAWGGSVPTLVSHIAALSGRLRPLSGEMRMSADKETFFGTHRFYCLPADIRAGDELRVGSRRFKIHAANDMMTFGRFMQVDCEEII